MATKVNTSPPLVVLRTGDKVLLTLTEDLDPGETGLILDGLRTSFPGVDFTIVTGVASICVQGGG